MNWGAFFRWSRWLHGYLSAFAFLSLMFFSATGLMLNHQDWLDRLQPKDVMSVTMVNPATLAAATRLTDPGPALAKAVAAKALLLGAYKSAEIADGEALIRLEGTKGTSDIAVDLATGKAEIMLSRRPLLMTLDELHKGRDAGAAWKLGIDISAVLFLVLSVIGYLLFFSLRLRLKTSLLVTTASILLMVGAFYFLAT
ncbi:MAG: PepSY-associated TM helix domain-containing protein [Alphaproteobacteria bacterium]